jgi:hypothetical protein
MAAGEIGSAGAIAGLHRPAPDDDSAVTTDAP